MGTIVMYGVLVVACIGVYLLIRYIKKNWKK